MRNFCWEGGRGHAALGAGSGGTNGTRPCASWPQRGGHLAALRWAVENGCPWDVDVCLALARSYANDKRHDPMMEWILRKKKPPARHAVASVAVADAADERGGGECVAKRGGRAVLLTLHK